MKLRSLEKAGQLLQAEAFNWKSHSFLPHLGLFSYWGPAATAEPHTYTQPGWLVADRDLNGGVRGPFAETMASFCKPLHDTRCCGEGIPGFKSQRCHELTRWPYVNVPVYPQAP